MAKQIAVAWGFGYGLRGWVLGPGLEALGLRVWGRFLTAYAEAKAYGGPVVRL